MNALNNPKSFRARFATYKLSGEFAYWWGFVSRGSNIDKITLNVFEQMLYERFFNEIDKANKVVEFMNLKHEHMTIA